MKSQPPGTLDLFASRPPPGVCRVIRSVFAPDPSIRHIPQNRVRASPKLPEIHPAPRDPAPRVIVGGGRRASQSPPAFSGRVGRSPRCPFLAVGQRRRRRGTKRGGLRG